MKNSAILFLCCIIFGGIAIANPVSASDAEAAALARLSRDNQSNSRLITNLFPVQSTLSSWPIAYIFELSPTGYVITSTDTRISPVIAYSYLSDCRIRGESESILIDLVRTDLQQRISSLEEVPLEMQNANIRSWNEYVSGVFTNTLLEQWPPAGSTPTEGWLEENWSQSSPYNFYCPMDLTSSSRSIAGCPAVAMGMILNFLKTTNNTRFNDGDDYFHNYNEYYWIDDDYEAHDFPSWPILNEYLTELDSLYENQLPLKDTDKAALVYASGAACKQVYTSSVSGTFGVIQAFNAYQRFAFTESELLDSSSDSLFERLSENMINALPAHLAIIDAASQYGHNVVLDGYNTDEFYHINFGWGGSNNAWYQFPLAGMPYSMNIIEGIILDISPTSQSISENPDAGRGEFALLSSLSNPVSTQADFQLTTPVTCNLTLSVFSISGRCVDTILEGSFAAGVHNFAWIPRDQPEGIYLLRASGNDFDKTLKITLIH